MLLSNYELNDKLYESKISIVYRALRKADNKSVIIKILNEEYPSKEQLSRFHYEYKLLKSFNSERIIKAYSFEKYGKSVAIVLENFGGLSINQYNLKSLSVKKALELFINVVETIDVIHKNNTIHKDISPSNILWNAKTDEVKIIDFGIATRLSNEKLKLINSDLLEGKLAYISPEQTGRMNRTIDYRSDLYSLGATFYEVFTNQKAFPNAKDEMELVHCHLARQPMAPHKINKNIPPQISQIIMKLMSKNAENRYQSIFGLKADLYKCLKQLEKIDDIEKFELGKEDHLNRFQIPEKLYGRTDDIEDLMEGFKRVCNGNTEMMLVSGSAGVGKSVLVNELHKPVVRHRAYYISGKYDQFQRSIPYRGIIEAFKEFIKQLLGESPEKIEVWKDKFIEALGANAQIIIDVIPRFELIIGKQKAVPELNSAEAQNRFNLVVQNFIQTVATAEHPLVIFLDDLQWADDASLKFIEMLLNAQGKGYLFVIGSYRDNEVEKSPQLELAIKEIMDNGVAINRIKLTHFGKKEICQLLEDCLKKADESIVNLADIILDKTEGNPFFINEFLSFIYSEKLITFDYDLREWKWDVDDIKKLGVTDNIVDLMIKKIKKLDSKTQEVLNLSAVIGNSFDIETLATIFHKSKTETAIDLWGALQANIIIPIDDSYKYTNDLESMNPRYKFLHDKIQQAAYSLIEENKRKELHLQLGRSISEEKQAEHVFDVVSHLNLARELIIDKLEKERLAELNFKAAIKAKRSAAYAQAYNYIKIAFSLFDNAEYRLENKLLLSLHIEGAEIAYLNADYNYMQELGEVVIKNAENLADKIHIYDIQVRTYLAKNNLVEAIDVVLHALSLLDINICKTPSEDDITQGLLKIQEICSQRKVEDLIELPQMTDLDKLAIMRIISTVMPVTYVANPSLVPMFAFTMVELSVKYGNAPASAFGYATYGLVLSGSVGDIDTGYKFGELALNLLNEIDAGEFKARTFFYVHLFITHWKKPLRDTLSPALEGYRSGLETGDIANGTLNAMLYGHHAYLCGKELSRLSIELEEYSNIMTRLKQEFTFSYNELYRYAVLSWQNPGRNSQEFYYEEYYEKMLPMLKETQNISAIWIVYLNKLMFNFVFEQFDQAYLDAVEAEKYIASATGAVTPSYFYLYDSLTRLVRYSKVNSLEQSKILEKVEANQEKMKKWADHAPMNFMHKLLLVEAEKAKVLGDNNQAEEYYDEAIDLAQVNGYMNEEALAYELAAHYYLSKNKKRVAECYLWQAYYAYQRWGATVKVDSLADKYSEFLYESDMQHIKPSMTKESSVGTMATTTLDFTSALKASQNLSGEIELNGLLDKMLRIIIENAGARKAFLVLEDEGHWFVEAEGKIDHNEEIETEVLTSIPLAEGNDYSERIIRYVIRTKESIVLNNASEEEMFLQDHYIIQNSPKAIICTPLIKQGKLIGVIYLENNLTAGVFTKDRIQLLNLLASQVAISVENAKVYAKLAQMNEILEDKVDEKTQGIRNLLDNAGQGFLRFARDYIVEAEYSRECEKLLGVIPSGKNILDLLDISKANLEDMKKILEVIFNSDKKLSRSRKNALISLLPQEVKLDSKILNIDYKLLGDNLLEKHIMMILTDITEKKELQKKMEVERENLKLITKIVKNKSIFLESICEYEEFCNKLSEKYLEEVNYDKIVELNRVIHTFKGDFAQWHMNNAVELLHAVESKLKSILEGNRSLDSTSIKNVFRNFEFYKTLEADLNIIEGYLGRGYMELSKKEEYFKVKKSKILALENKIIDLNREELQDILLNVRELRLIEFREMLLIYVEYTMNLANKLEKKINPFEVIGGNFLVERENYRKITKSLVHLFRNIIDHGIENEESRRNLGKDIFGEIQCKISKNSRFITIEVSDDGRGLQFEKIKDSLIELGKFNRIEVEAMSESELIDLVLSENFSTKKIVSTISGRGIGLSEIKYELDQIGGNIDIKTKQDEGTQVTIKIPLL